MSSFSSFIDGYKNISKIKSKDIIYNYLCLANILQNKDIVDKATEVANLYKL